MKTPISAKPLDHLRGHRHLAVPAAFAIDNAEDPALAIDVFWPQPHGFTHTQSAVIDQGQHRLKPDEGSVRAYVQISSPPVHSFALNIADRSIQAIAPLGQDSLPASPYLLTRKERRVGSSEGSVRAYMQIALTFAKLTIQGAKNATSAKDRV